MPRISEDFRQAMNWTHTWLGVVLGIVLFAVFWMGTLTIFAPEIDRWMIPETRIAHDGREVSYDRLLAQLPPDAATSDYVNFVVPTERHPTIGVFYRDSQGAFQNLLLDPRTGAPISVTDSHAGSGFIYPFHLSLTIEWQNLGYWIVGLAALAMLLLLVSGIFVHRKIIAELFVFRPQRKPRRATLDLHNLSSLVGLPFYILMPFSGLLIFASLYLPWGMAEPFGGDMDKAEAAISGAYDPGPRTGRPAPIASLDAMKRKAEAMWSETEGAPVKTNILRILNNGDESAVVYFRNTFPEDRVVLSKYVAVLDGQSGAVLQDFVKPPIGEASAWVQGAHFIQFGHWPLRWLYFLGGLGGCVMIATGNLFWLRSREGRLARASLGYRTVEALTIGGVTGIIAATGAFFVANRLIPADAFPVKGARADAEVQVFWLVWLIAFVHAAILRERAWAQQAWAIAVLAIAAVASNAVTTGDHIGVTLAEGEWAVAGMDLLLLITAGIAAWAAIRLAPSPMPERPFDPMPAE
ncbi:PepSY-associated TM helix domain-containing protein [Erythrobacter sp. T5W1-R]|uniref:PepSY-associated TM helix domain-containing protein n=1 Tax=Erythrobacter sp. T5W1-R TaxID=3101752 RepID=UPI002AFFD4F4|nr:PepSY-associated TM helix domain-containing protein [Erythrobacter sp. T5W1-R]MEA1618039.1 PepSY-associated TM helix domain-containing protein [Erythrobacter sp. T5W1-R]